MLSQSNYERYIHYRDHVQNNTNNINYVRLSNCKYCKQDRRDFYGSRFRFPHTISRNNIRNLNLRNYDRIRNIIGSNNVLPQTQNFINHNINQIIESTINNNPTPNYNIERYVPSIPSTIRSNNYSIERHNETPLTQNNFNIRYPRRISRRHYARRIPQRHTLRENRSNILRNNYTQNNLNVQYFRNNLGIIPLPTEEIEDFEELTDVEVKTLFETVNKESELEVYYGFKREHCTICCDNINYSQIVRKLKCGHIFHHKCIDEWLENNTKCPVCRFNLSTEN